MLVRLAFSLMMEVDADILLIDEVLAVGDAAFQQKCADAFHQMKAEGKTVVLVTHEMSTVEDYCHRAMLIDEGTSSTSATPPRSVAATCASTSSTAARRAAARCPRRARRCACSTPGSRTPAAPA